MSKRQNRCIATFSIVGCDPATGEIGVAVQSKFLAVGNAVPWAKGGVGAIATQAMANTSYGPNGLVLLEQGLHPEEVVKRLIEADEERETRQFGIVDIKGRSATYTGKDCFDWAGGIAGENFAAQGNILVSGATVDALAKTFVDTKGDLAEKLMCALEAAQKAGGDKRGMQSAAMYIAKTDGGYGGFNDRYVDVRVDDHEKPIEELRRILELYRFYGFKTKEGNYAKIEGAVKDFILDVLVKKGYYTGDMTPRWNEEMHKAFLDFGGTENFDERLAPIGLVDREVLDFMRKNY